MVTQGYTEGNSRTNNGPLILCVALFSESYLSKEQLALANEVKSRSYGLLHNRLAGVRNDIREPLAPVEMGTEEAQLLGLWVVGESSAFRNRQSRLS